MFQIQFRRAQTAALLTAQIAACSIWAAAWEAAHQVVAVETQEAEAAEAQEADSKWKIKIA